MCQNKCLLEFNFIVFKYNFDANNYLNVLEIAVEEMRKSETQILHIIQMDNI